ncbi:hypothetical protein BR93DRAFT_977188 [Coniochaeta sp. PMI_546]|nr:hypothetical protein BR93DRAFT_977188 [Coniochaeta sp. PMI_546]
MWRSIEVGEWMESFWLSSLHFWHGLQPVYDRVDEYIHERRNAYFPPLDDEDEDEEDEEEDDEDM